MLESGSLQEVILEFIVKNHLNIHHLYIIIRDNHIGFARICFDLLIISSN